MTEKDLKKMNRYQILELLLVQTERADKLQLRLEEAEKKLNNLNITISSLGSIAEAALQLNGIFQSAQEAADMYLEEAKKRADEIEKEAHRRKEEIIAQALKDSARIKEIL